MTIAVIRFLEIDTIKTLSVKGSNDRVRNASEEISSDSLWSGVHSRKAAHVMGFGSQQDNLHNCRRYDEINLTKIP